MLYETILKKVQNNIFHVAEKTETEFLTLLYFLTSDVLSCSRYAHIKQYLLDSKDCNTGFDMTFFDIRENEIYIQHAYWDELPFFKTSRQNLIKILDNWHSILKQQPPFIKITMDEHQNVTFTALKEYYPA